MGFKEFLKKLKGWMTNPDGEDYCPTCWPWYLAKFDDDEKIKTAVKEDSCSTKTKAIAKSRRASDCWLVICEKCGKSAFSPYLPQEAPKRKK